MIHFQDLCFVFQKFLFHKIKICVEIRQKLFSWQGSWDSTHICRSVSSQATYNFTAQKLKFFRSFLRIWSHLLEKSLMENFIFCAMNLIKKCSIRPTEVKKIKLMYMEISLCGYSMLRRFKLRSHGLEKWSALYWISFYVLQNHWGECCNKY